MAHFAEIDENNIVLQVLVVPDEQEDRGQEYLAVDCNLGGTWIQTSFNGKIRKRFAGIGGTYNQELDAFLTPKPYPSWVFDENELDWIPPTAKPDAGIDWYWSEDELKWLLS
jgi:hypothetical protein